MTQPGDAVDCPACARLMVLLLGLLVAGGVIPGREMELNGTWLMKEFTKGVGRAHAVYLKGFPEDGFRRVNVPTTVRAALMGMGDLPDPYFGTQNEGSLWVEEQEWWFVKTFDLPGNLQGKYIDLLFEGIVYQGDVWLNGRFLGHMEGMFNPRSFPVSSLLVYGGQNRIAVCLEAPQDAMERNLQGGYQYDVEPERPQRHVICQSMYGWDWAPHMVPTGIWRPVKLVATDALRLDVPWVRACPGTGGRARIEIRMAAENLSEEVLEATLEGTVRPKNFEGETRIFREHVRMPPHSRQTVNKVLFLDNAHLWWPNGMGRQDLYAIELHGLMKGTPSDTRTSTFGIREIRIVNNENRDVFLQEMKEAVAQAPGQGNNLKDVQHMGKVVGSYPWTFTVNGKKMFCKGSNWVPADQMLRLGRDRYEHLLELARQAHFNMLRVWGGGLFETDDFYELCDEKGILNWFEFLSSSSVAELNRELFVQASRATIRRIRNHPSLTYYCGGNEFDPDGEVVRDLIDQVEAVVGEEDPVRPFRRASPYMGDDHFWGVWHRFAPYTAYRRIRPFRSEAGINAMPVLDSWLAFTPQEKRWPLTREWIEYRGSYQTRFSHLPKQDRYAGEYGPSRSLGEYIRKSQLAQALGDAFNIEFCRSRKFQNSGVLIWQFNDAYPCASWSMVDWYGTPKSSYYAIKRANRPLHVAADFETYLWKPGQTFVAEISLLNDLEEAFRNMRVESSLWDVQGALLDRKKVEGGVGANRSRTVLTHQWQIPKTMDGRMFFLSVRLINPKCQLVSDLIYPMAVRDVEALPFTDEQARDRNFNRFSHYANIFEEIAELPLLKPDILCRWESGKGLQVRITNKGRSLLFQARLRLMHEGSPIQAFYQDNDVTLLPGETRLIEVRGLKGGLVPQGSELVLEDWNALDRKVIPLDTSGGPHGSAQRGR